MQILPSKLQMFQLAAVVDKLSNHTILYLQSKLKVTADASIAMDIWRNPRALLGIGTGTGSLKVIPNLTSNF